jgi:hypothetical protein
MMKKTLYILLLMGVSTNVLAEFVYDPICPLVEDAAMMVMAERQDGTSESEYRSSVDGVLKQHSNIYSPRFINTLKGAIYPLIDAAYKIPIRENEEDKVKEIEAFGLYGYEACAEEFNKNINEDYPED